MGASRRGLQSSEPQCYKDYVQCIEDFKGGILSLKNLGPEPLPMVWIRGKEEALATSRAKATPYHLHIM